MENPTQLHLPVLTPGPGASLPADLLRQPWLVPGGNLPPFGGPCVVGVPPTVLSRQFHPLGPHHPAGVLTTGKGTGPFPLIPKHCVSPDCLPGMQPREVIKLLVGITPQESLGIQARTSGSSVWLSLERDGGTGRTGIWGDRVAEPPCKGL